MQNISEIKLIKYELEPCLEKVKAFFESMKKSTDYNQFKVELIAMNNYLSELGTMSSLVSYRYYGNTADDELKALNDHYAMVSAQLSGLSSEIDQFIGASSFLKNIKEEFGQNIYTEYKNSTFTINETAQKLLEEDEKLRQEVMAFKAQSKVTWEGEEIPFSKLTVYANSDDRQTRKKAFDIQSEYYLNNEDFFNNSLLKLIEIRNQFARELGFKNYADYSIIKWNRIGYDYTDLKKYRDSVSKYFKDIFQLSHDLKISELEIETVKYYDSVYFKDGLAKLTEPNAYASATKFSVVLEKINHSWKKVYDEMLANKSFDYESRDNKAEIGFANYLSSIKTPIIYSVFHNLSTDIRVLAHEFGHALQFETSWRNSESSAMDKYTLDTVEIFSHAMEMLTYPAMEDFFGAETRKYKIDNFLTHLRILNTTAMGDEFQEIIYTTPNITKEILEKTYADLQLKYTGNFADYSENEFYCNGKIWKNIDHYFSNPFYLVDYSLATVNALNIYKIAKSDQKQAMELWEKLARNIKNLNYQNIKNIDARTINPFDEADVKSMAEFAREELKELMG
jgi:M3 family oligoendopeptidase